MLIFNKRGSSMFELVMSITVVLIAILILFEIMIFVPDYLKLIDVHTYTIKLIAHSGSTDEVYKRTVDSSLPFTNDEKVDLEEYVRDYMGTMLNIPQNERNRRIKIDISPNRSELQLRDRFSVALTYVYELQALSIDLKAMNLEVPVTVRWSGSSTKFSKDDF